MIRRIGRKEILNKLSRQDNRVVFVEATTLADYEKVHLPRAVFIEPADVLRLAPTYFPNQAIEIVIYGEDSNDPRPEQAAKALQAANYFNVLLYSGGKADWVQAGLSTETPIRPMALPQPWLINVG